MAKGAFSKRKELLTKGLSRTVKKKIVKAVVWSVALYGAETWALRKEDVRRLDAFEMWVWRKMEKISWTEHRTNEDVLKMVGEKRTLVDAILRRKKNWIGHILRGEGLMREVIEGRMKGSRTVGRPRYGMLDELYVDEKETYGGMKKRAQDRESWRCWLPWTCLRAEH